eukprot:TRINITY_DN10651_c0_g1_i1.p1 TRINITY_DN10651_c0_g1~~TRINITY_DN10651_c0_g1_i1.p1  ORF type:complete len:462 (+),score=106.88 TRINITY_DN10651_c0_g1_i1:47-1387(+)
MPIDSGSSSYESPPMKPFPATVPLSIDQLPDDDDDDDGEDEWSCPPPPSSDDDSSVPPTSPPKVIIGIDDLDADDTDSEGIPLEPESSVLSLNRIQDDDNIIHILSAHETIDRQRIIIDELQSRQQWVHPSSKTSRPTSETVQTQTEEDVQDELTSEGSRCNLDCHSSADNMADSDLSELFIALQEDEEDHRSMICEDAYFSRMVLLQVALVWAWRLGSLREKKRISEVTKSEPTPPTEPAESPDPVEVSETGSSPQRKSQPINHPSTPPRGSRSKSPQMSLFSSSPSSYSGPRLSQALTGKVNACHLQYGEMQYQGWLFIVRGGADAVWVKRFFTLTGGLVWCGRTQTDPTPRLLFPTSELIAVERDDRLKSENMCGSLTVPPGGPQHSFGFQVAIPARDPTPTQPVRIIRFAASSSQNRAAWIAAMKDGMPSRRFPSRSPSRPS